MKLSQCKHGILVTHIGSFSGEEKGVVGMVVGITENNVGEPIPLVQFQNSETPRGIHSSQISLYEE